MLTDEEIAKWCRDRDLGFSRSEKVPSDPEVDMERLHEVGAIVWPPRPSHDANNDDPVVIMFTRQPSQANLEFAFAWVLLKYPGESADYMGKHRRDMAVWLLR